MKTEKVKHFLLYAAYLFSFALFIELSHLPFYSIDNFLLRILLKAVLYWFAVWFGYFSILNLLNCFEKGIVEDNNVDKSEWITIKNEGNTL